MSSPQIIYSVLEDIGFSTYSSTPGFPVTNLEDYNLSTYWKAVGEFPSWIQLDFGVATTVNTLIMEGQNLVSANGNGGNCDLIASSDPTFVSDLHAIIELLPSADGQFYATFSDFTYRYFRFRFSNDAGMTSAPQVSNIFLTSTKFSFTSPYDWTYKADDAAYTTNETININGNTRSSQNYKGRRLWELAYRLQDTTMRNNFQSFVRAVRGKLRPFYWIDTDGTTIRYLHMDDYVPIAVNQFGYNDIQNLTMREHEALV